MDVTAGWTRLSSINRAERLRDLTFLSGLSSEWLWGIKKVHGEHQHLLRPGSCIEACRGLGYIVSLGQTEEDLPTTPLSPSSIPAMHAAISELRAAVSDAPAAQHLVDGLIELVTEMISVGLPDTCQVGNRYTAALSPVADSTRETFATLDHVSPDQVVERIDSTIRNLSPSQSISTLIEMVTPHLLSHNADLHPDDIGPMLIGIFGYYRERASDFRRAAPGMFPDQIHGRHALSSAIFITGERRLPRRLAAWAAFTGRGASHNTWPVILEVQPSDKETVRHAAETVTTYTKKHPDAAIRGLHRSPPVSDLSPSPERPNRRTRRKKQTGGRRK